MGIKETVKEWIEEQWKKRVKDPIAQKTKQLENSATQQFNKYSGQVKEQVNKPIVYYQKQEAFYRGVFWIAICCLVVLWMISGK